jgi:hypothetical protein
MNPPSEFKDRHIAEDAFRVAQVAAMLSTDMDGLKLWLEQSGQLSMVHNTPRDRLLAMRAVRLLEYSAYALRSSVKRHQELHERTKEFEEGFVIAGFEGLLNEPPKKETGVSPTLGTIRSLPALRDKVREVFSSRYENCRAPEEIIKSGGFNQWEVEIIADKCGKRSSSTKEAVKCKTAKQPIKAGPAKPKAKKVRKT